MSLIITKYEEKFRDKWDRFVQVESMNGTFLQTRKFIEYHHEGKFKDVSILVLKGNQIVACILACEVIFNEKLTFYSHRGTSFGGIIISRNIYNASNISEMMDVLEEYFHKEGYEQIYFKMTPSVYVRENTELLDYFLFQRGYEQYNELNYFLELEKYNDDILQNFTAGKRRDCKYAFKNSLKFRQLTSFYEIKEFYEILLSNLARLELSCVHTFEDLLDIKFNRFNEKVEFYGVYLDGKLIAGSMIFLFDENIIHTQYLASDKDYLKFFSMDYMIYNLIEVALNKKKRYFTFGICTENEGKYLNMGLSRFKEGFGTEYFINRTYYKKLF